MSTSTSRSMLEEFNEKTGPMQSGRPPGNLINPGIARNSGFAADVNRGPIIIQPHLER